MELLLQKKTIILFICLFFVVSGLSTYAQKEPAKKQKELLEFSIPLDHRLSPYTGFTREHWLKITEKIIAGGLSCFNDKTGMPDFRVPQGFSAFEKLRLKSPEEAGKRALERMMMAVVIYTKATGKDEVPGYAGSISAPFLRAIINGTDPKSPLYWGDPLPNDQVGSIFSIAIYLEPERYWNKLTSEQKSNLLYYLNKQVFNKTYNNNHYYFHMLPMALLEQNGFESNRTYLTQMSERLMGWYRGDGWFLDGSNRGFDNYNLWGFQLFNQVLFKFDSRWRSQFGYKIKKTTSKFLESFPWLYGRDGGPIPWGRSLTYRFAGISAIAWATLNGMNNIPPGQSRRIASGSLKYFWEHGCLDENKLLTIGFRGANASVAEDYIYYGDPYWATQGLACLLIPEADPFWTAIEEPMPADGPVGKLALPGAQFTIRISATDGEARLFPVGQPWAQERSRWQNGVKYDQHAYSSYLGFCVLGEGGEDLGAGRSGYSYDGKNWFYRERAKPILVAPDHLISTYSLKPKDSNDTERVENRDEIITNTLIGEDGELHIFWHNYPDPIYLTLGGYGISVPHGTDLIQQSADNDLLIQGGEYYSVIKKIQAPEGKLVSRELIPKQGWVHTHLFGGNGAYPFWESAKPVPPNIPVIFYVNGTRNRRPVIGSIEVIKQENELKIRFEGVWHTVTTPF